MCILFAPRGALPIAACWALPPSNMRHPPRALLIGPGRFCLAACWDSPASTRHPLGTLAGVGSVGRVRVGNPLLSACAIRPGDRSRRGGFLCGESPQRSGDVARIRCVPRVSVPKPCIRASAPHAPVFRGSENTIDMQGLLALAFWRCAFAPGSGFVRRRSSLPRTFAQAGCVFAMGSPHKRDGVVRCAFQKLASGARFARLPGAPLRSSSRRVSRESGRRRRRFPPLRRLSGQCA